ncbi:MAG: DUF503 domain-containing protein [Syntrophomonadaceae bacterium]|nr:DUF503 domain-containing protein [Syntrophomonadaceae bacterium]
MYGVAGTIEVFLPDSHSLKERRKIVNSLKAKLHKNHNMSVADVSDDNIWQRARLDFALVASSMQSLQETSDAVDRLLVSYPELEIIRYDFKYL